MAEITRHYLISGRVQGVGYRAFTRHSAEELKLGGWVRNLSDGRVEAVAQGSSERLDLFEAKLKKGPIHGQVEDVAVQIRSESRVYLEFEVRKGGDKPCP